ncbi:interferon regulatory factor 1-like isoform X2 [Liolophura sinensis]|uniref:interferon regulatory factor 1-like isoform X2 n=1 Tax=Liolophura sinensis TaxID=3198878 RepID=UPI00315924FF
MKEKKRRTQKRGRQRERMRPWLENLLNTDACPGLKWRDKERKVFVIPWKHASGRTWKQIEDPLLFKLYAVHTGKFKEGQEPDPKKWKANFRCALNSLLDVEELKEETHKKGEGAKRVYRFVDDCSSTSKRKSDIEYGSQRKRARCDSSDESSSQETYMSGGELTDDQSMQETCVKAEVKVEVSNQCAQGETDEVVMEEPTDHDYSQRETFQPGIPNLPAFRNPTLQSGGTVTIEERKPLPSQVNYDDLKSLIPGSKIIDGDLDSNSTSSGENMTDEEVVDMVYSMGRSRGEEGFSESESPYGSSPESSPPSELWNYPSYSLLALSDQRQPVRVFPDDEAHVVTETISESRDWNITALGKSNSVWE